MVLTLGAAPLLFGPGHRIFVTVPGGPIPNDDFIQVIVTRTADGVGFTYGITVTNGALVTLVTIGYDERLGRIVSGNPVGMASGTPISVLAQQYHANLTLVDSSLTTPYGSLDLQSFPWTLLRWAGSSDTAAILAAVRKLFSNAP